jgi:hypothetical protein
LQSVSLPNRESILSEVIMDVNVGIFAAMPPEPELPVIHERRCPSCQSPQIKPGGHVIAGDGMIKSQLWCEPCGTAFWFARRRIPSLPK